MVDRAPNDRQMNKLPPPYLKSSTPYAGSDFRPEVKSACISNRLISAGLKISKVIILGNVAVGKSCLVNRYHQFITVLACLDIIIIFSLLTDFAIASLIRITRQP